MTQLGLGAWLAEMQPQSTRTRGDAENSAADFADGRRLNAFRCGVVSCDSRLALYHFNPVEKLTRKA
jgi:hypothetical protein